MPGSIPVVNLFRKAENIFDFKHSSVIQNRFAAHASENLMLIRYENLEVDLCCAVKHRDEGHLKASV